MKTVMQELIEKSGWTKESLFCQGLLEKEKQQIIQAFEQGYSDCNTDQDCLPGKYYNDTFKP
jgi:hypothetical protein